MMMMDGKLIKKKKGGGSGVVLELSLVAKHMVEIFSHGGGATDLRFWGWMRIFPENSSVEVGFLWEGAAGSLDDDVGGVVRSLHAPFQGIFLDELRQETYGDSGAVRRNPQETGNNKAVQKTYMCTHIHIFKLGLSVD